jgi:hypothetical protein
MEVNHRAIFKFSRYHCGRDFVSDENSSQIPPNELQQYWQERCLFPCFLPLFRGPSQSLWCLNWCPGISGALGLGPFSVLPNGNLSEIFPQLPILHSRNSSLVNLFWANTCMWENCWMGIIQKFLIIFWHSTDRLNEKF